MNAAIGRPEPQIEPCRLLPSDAARRRLAQRLTPQVEHERQFDQVLAASSLYGVDPRELRELYDYWQHDFELERQPLFRLPSFRLRAGNDSLRFVQVRSTQTGALPLLLLHGETGSLAEVATLAPELSEPASATTPFHVVCPALDDLPRNRAEAASACAELMRALGYSRYLVHGSEGGAAVALELAAETPDRVAGVHVTRVAAYPSEEAGELSSLSSAEKSQLAALSELYERLGAEAPESPLESLALSLSQLADTPATNAAAWRDPLLTGLSFRWSNGMTQTSAELAELCLAPSRASRAPLSVQSFPLDAPSLRRFVERQHRVAEWREHERGGACPALEQPRSLLDSLRQFAARLG
jgi:pimeloyl-ACP methyl ester carboxylesterase